MIETSLKGALKDSDTIKSPIGEIACYSLNFAELAGEVNVFMEGNKVKFTWREYIKLAQIIWDKIKETSRECAGKEIEVKVPAKFGLISAAFALIGFKLQAQRIATLCVLQGGALICVALKNIKYESK